MPEHLSNVSLKLLKLVVLSGKLRTCQKGKATIETYTDIARLLLCISRVSRLNYSREGERFIELFEPSLFQFAELKDTPEQFAVADLYTEAKSLVS